MKKIALILTGALFMLTGCHRAPVENLEGNWTTENLTTAEENVEVVISNIELKQKSTGNYSFTGNSGVNQFFGAASFKKGVYSATDDCGSTKMMGSPVEQHFEDIFLSCITKADSYKLEENTLVIESTKENIKLTLKRAE